MGHKKYYFRRALILFLIVGVSINLFALSRVKADFFAKGADVSWLPQMEAKGYKFYNDNGTQQDCLQILKDHGINSIRLRTWVNPSNNPYDGHCNKDETVAMAKRVSAMGFKIMLDFHYSDSWADPGKQVKPAAWAKHSFDQLVTDVHDYTYDVMSALKSDGITPEWVQIGNEIRPGMLLPDGSTWRWKQLAQLINAGYDAVKATSSDSKVTLQLDNGFDNSMYQAWFDGARKNGVKYDIIGMSLYSSSFDWSTKTTQCLYNMNNMVERYGKEVMICEVGMESTTEKSCQKMLTDLIKKTQSVKDGKGLGVFYWEPESYSWNNYRYGAWEANGRPSIALDAFLEGNVFGKAE
jgi:arabinogalactan endo-1,4-beta-galactosidase